MASEELRASWQRTRNFLLESRAHFSKPAERVCRNQLKDFETYLEQNELELALDMLEAAFEKSGVESWRVLELMAMAAASMSLDDRQQRYDARLSKARGGKYETLPPT